MIECYKKVVHYLDITFNFKDGTSQTRSHHKADNKITYINVQSNHLPKIIKQLPEKIENNCSKTSL